MSSDNSRFDSDISDREYFSKIYSLYWGKIYQYCFYHLQDSENAKEIVQDIFFSFWERRKTLKIEGSEENYLIRAAKYKVFDFYRNQVKQTELTGQAAENNTENEVMYNSLLKQLNELITNLPEQCKNVFKLSREQGLSNKQIASDLVISEKAVEYHITKAIKYLRKNLKEYEV